MWYSATVTLLENLAVLCVLLDDKDTNASILWRHYHAPSIYGITLAPYHSEILPHFKIFLQSLEIKNLDGKPGYQASTGVLF